MVVYRIVTSQNRCTGALGQSYVAIETVVRQSPIAIHDKTPFVTLFVMYINGGRAVKFIDKTLKIHPKSVIH